MAGIYKGHFDDDHLRLLAEHDSFPLNRKYNNEYQAFQYFRSYYPSCKSFAHIKFMNYNAPIEATNINNPSPRIQQLIQTSNNNNHKELPYFHPDRLEPFIVLSRTAASNRMKALGKTPSHSFDFLPANYQRIYHSPSDLPIDTTNLPTPKVQTSTTSTQTITEMIHDIQTQLQHDDDISQISHHTTSLQLSEPSHLTTNNSSPNRAHLPHTPIDLTNTKRARINSNISIDTYTHHRNITVPPPIHLRFIIPTILTKEAIFNAILQNNTQGYIKPGMISPDIAFVPIITNLTLKMAFITITHRDHL